MAGLTKKMELFIQEYLVDMNATRAAIAAGYSPNTAAEMGYENLNKPQIKARIEEVLGKRIEKLELTADHFAARLERIADAAARSALETNDETGVSMLVSKEAADVARACSMDTAKLLGLVVERRETTVIQHEDRLAAAREKLNERRPTAH
jgi:phage terminase small subunit